MSTTMSMHGNIWPADTEAKADLDKFPDGKYDAVRITARADTSGDYMALSLPPAQALALAEQITAAAHLVVAERAALALQAAA